MKRCQLVSVALFAAAGCVGSISDRGEKGGNSPSPAAPGNPGSGTGPGGNPGSNPGGPGNPVLIPPAPGQNGACQETPPPVLPTRRLTRDQYLATVRDLLGDTRDLSDRFPADDKGEAVFAPPDTLTVTPTWADKLLSSAEELAKTAMANPARLLPCNPSGNEDACADQFIKTFGKRAFRRPLNADDVAGLTAIYKTGAAQGGFASGIELVISTILQSPSFVYRVELGQKAGSIAGAVKLTPHEVASRLSYFIWGTMPDQLLFEAADTGKLTSAEDIGAQVERMMKDPRARTTLVGFNQRLFGTDIIDEASKDGETYPQFTDEVKAAMKAEFQAYVEDALFAGDGSLDTLLTSKTTFVNTALASLYGVPAPGGTGLQKVQLDGTQRAGLLTTVGLLSAHTISDTSAPIIRGKFIRERLLCTELAEPPPGLEVEAPAPKPGMTTRELLVQHATSPSCSACHDLMDPIGFGYGNFDGIGRWRTTEEGKAVDASGRLTNTDVDGEFRGPVQLAQKLASSQQVSDCVMTTMLNFVQGTQLVQDACLTSRLRKSFDDSKHDLRALVLAIARSDGFQYRRQLPGEVLP